MINLKKHKFSCYTSIKNLHQKYKNVVEVIENNSTIKLILTILVQILKT